MRVRRVRFSLWRAGLKSDHYIPLRLRAVDMIFSYGFFIIPIASALLTMESFRWANKFGLGVIWESFLAFLVYGMVTMLSSICTLAATWKNLLTMLFRFTGMLLAGESEQFPLSLSDAWPDEWQQPDNPSG